LLAATPAEMGGYPATLYRVDAGKLKVVREVIPQTEGVRSVRMWGNAIFLAHPQMDSPMEPYSAGVTIIHTNDPLQPDDEPIQAKKAKDFFINLNDLALAEPRPSIVDELLATIVGAPSPGNVDLLVVSGDRARSPRVKHNVWSEYAALRYEGATGG